MSARETIPTSLPSRRTGTCGGDRRHRRGGLSDSGGARLEAAGRSELAPTRAEAVRGAAMAALREIEQVRRCRRVWEACRAPVRQRVHRGEG